MLPRTRRGRSLDTEAHDAWVADVARELDLSHDAVEFLVSAIGSYRLRATVLRGLWTSYDREYEEIFRALDVLVAEGHGP